MKLTKKEISENTRGTRRSGFGSGFDYNVSVRGFKFETLRDRHGELMHCHDDGNLTFVGYCSNKKEVVDAIYKYLK